MLKRILASVAAVCGVVLAVALLNVYLHASPDTAPADGAAAPPGNTSIEGMKVVIFNDDSIQATQESGSDGEGIYELRKALCAAGADVIVVGPWTVQSGQGSRITLTGPMTVQQVTPPAGYESDCGNSPSMGKVFGICSAQGPCVAPGGATPPSPSASPSDVASIALTKFIPENYWPEGPDLVLSGVNYGQNDAKTLVHSGTTNAAVTAHRLGYPAIAASEELVLSCLTQHVSCPEFANASTFVAKLVGKLNAAGLITPDLLLNVNYPNLAEGETVQEPQINVLGDCSALNFGPKGEVGADGGTYTMGLVPSCTETVKNADTTALAGNHVSIVPLDGDWTAKKVDGNLNAIVKQWG